MFELAAKLIWSGGEDVYGAGKKDIATLYEYWVFFKLLDLFQELFEMDSYDISDLWEPSDNNLNLKLKQGKHINLRGICKTDYRKLHVKFHYNRTFNGDKTYPDPGSWTRKLRPDYTLSFWPFDISEEDAEIQELIVHIHFDAKYKIANFYDLIVNDLDEEKLIIRKEVLKEVIFLKMHAYKDAIRRTGGAYILYPGESEEWRKKSGFMKLYQV